jgi:hypothetical protein
VKDVDDFEKRDEAAAERHECKGTRSAPTSAPTTPQGGAREVDGGGALAGDQRDGARGGSRAGEEH